MWFQEIFDIKGIEHNHSFEKYKFFNRLVFYFTLHLDNKSGQTCFK